MGWHVVAAEDALGDDEALGVRVGEVPIAIVRAGGAVHAIHNVCTHQYALLSDGYVEDGCIECPLHQGRFELTTGLAKSAPVTEPVKVYPVKVEGGKILVELDDQVPG
jgi:3-phenylpropionate/trans-cinnamate dioxygenase ferredoxin subunit